MKVVIFAGGVGTRLWPLSRKKSPKQFQKIFGGKSTLQLSVERVLPLTSPENIYISTGKIYAQLVRAQLPQIPRKNIILEPERREVGPAVGLITSILAKLSPNEPFLLMWSDHFLENEHYFHQMVKAAEKYIRKNKERIVLFGEKPRFPDPNLGWIKLGKKVAEIEEIPFFQLESFYYQPGPSLAEEFWKKKNYIWNLGYWLTTPSYLFSCFQRFVPNIYQGLLQIQKVYGTDRFEEVLEKEYKRFPKITFDNAVAEQLPREEVLVLKGNLHWHDVGSWDGLADVLAGIGKNYIQGSVLTKDATGCLFLNLGTKTLVGIDLKDLVVVNTDDVLLVAPRKSMRKLKKFVEELEKGQNSHLV